MAPESHRRPISAVNTSNNRKNIFNTLERKRIRLDHASYKKAKVNHIFIPLNKKCDSILITILTLIYIAIGSIGFKEIFSFS